MTDASSPATESKSAALAERYLVSAHGARPITGFAEARAVLRDPLMHQAGIGADRVRVDDPDQLSVFFLDGERHKKRRAAIARYFTPRAIETRYRAVVEESTDRLLAELKREGRGRIDDIGYRLAVDVAAEIIGLTNSDRRAMGRRINAILDGNTGARLRGRLGRAVALAMTAARTMLFFARDIRPAIKARLANPREDVLSFMVEQKYSTKALLIECLTYGAAGMVTTREFISMAAWHLLESESLRGRFLDGDEAVQTALLEEILRVEPVASMLHRRPAAGSGEVCALNVRAANLDEAAAGRCPHHIDPDRGSFAKAPGPVLSFGDGAHRCPGAQVALAETRLFIDRLLRLPGIRLASKPHLTWRHDLMSYEIRDAVVTCDRQ